MFPSVLPNTTRSTIETASKIFVNVNLTSKLLLTVAPPVLHAVISQFSRFFEIPTTNIFKEHICLRDYIDYNSLSVPHGPPPYRKFGGPHTRRLGLEAGPGGSIREVGSLKAVLQRSENCSWKG